jgi:hypothetical protein
LVYFCHSYFLSRSIFLLTFTSSLSFNFPSTLLFSPFL